jgi:hypothetical protein
VDPVGAPASGADRPIHYTFMLDGQVFADWIERSSRNKRFIMHKGVITN